MKRVLGLSLVETFFAQIETPLMVRAALLWGKCAKNLSWITFVSLKSPISTYIVLAEDTVRETD